MYSSRALKHSKYAKRRRIKKLWTGVGIIVLFGFILGSFAYAFHMDAIRISTIEVEGTNTIDSNALQASIHEALQDSYGYLIPKDNAFFYPKDAITQSLVEKYPALSYVKITRPTLTTVKASVVERETALLACNGEISVEGTLPEECFAVDKSGFIYLKAPIYSERVYTRYYDARDAEPFKEGTKLAEEGTLNALQSIVLMLTTKGYTVIGVVFTQEGMFEIHMRSDQSGGTSKTVIYLDDREGLAKVEKNLNLFFDERSKMITKASPEFDYIDIRYGNSIYYKLHGNEERLIEQ